MGKAPGTDTLPEIPGVHSVPNALSLVTLSLFVHSPPTKKTMAVALYVLSFKRPFVSKHQWKNCLHVFRNAKTGWVLPLMLWAKGICTLLFPPGSSQQFQHLSVRLIRRETERKLVLDQKFKPESESSISSFPFLMQRRDKAGSKALLLLQTQCLCLLWCQSTHSAHVLRFPPHGNSWRESWWLLSSWLSPSGQWGRAAPQTLQPHGQPVQAAATEERKECAIVK